MCVVGYTDFLKKKMLCKNNSKQSFTADHSTPLELFFSYRVNNILVYRSVSCFFCLLVFIRLLKAPVLIQHNALLPRPVGEDRKHWPWFATLLDLTTLVFFKKKDRLIPTLLSILTTRNVYHINDDIIE